MGNDWKHKARELIESQRGQRQKVEYTLKLEVEQEEQELGQIRAHHAKSIEGCADEYDRFKNEHAAHTIIQDVHHLQSQVHQLEATQQALLSYIKFGELRLLFEGEMEVGEYANAIEGFIHIPVLAKSSEKFPKLHTAITQFIEETKSNRLDNLLPSLLRQAQEEAGWPSNLDLEKEKAIIAFMEAFQNLLIYDFTFNSGNEDRGEQAIRILMEPVELRFHYHFSTDRSTNRLDKPEWFLQHLKSLGEQECGDFVHRFLQPEHIPIDILTLFLRELAKLAREKLFNNLSYILSLEETEEREELLRVTIEAAIEYLEEEDLEEFVEMAKEAFDSWLHSVHAQTMSAYEEALSSNQFISEIKAELERWLELITKLALLPSMQCRLFEKTVIALLTRVLNKLEYECPLSNMMSQSEAGECVTLLKSVLELTCFVSEWGEDLGVIELAATAEFKKMSGYDASKLKGTVFYKTIQALSALEEKIKSRLEGFVYDGFSSGATSWANSMHYNSDDDSEECLMHDGFRKALVDLEPRIKLLSQSEELSPVMVNVLRRISDFLLHKLIFRNYFSLAGALRFNTDVGLLRQILGDTPTVQVALQPVRDAVVLLRNEDDELVRLLKEENVEEATRLLQEMNIESLPLDTCEQVLASIKK